VPSPKLNVYPVMVVPSWVVEAEASAVTVNGTIPVPGVTLTAANGGSGAVTDTTALAVDESPALFVTVTPAM
jgi:hypothetical protein